MAQALQTLRGWLSHKQTFWLLLGGGMLLRLALILSAWDAPLEGDARWYGEAAEQWLNGGGYDPYWPPGLTTWLALWKGIFGSGDGVARLSILPWALLFFMALRPALRAVSNEAFTNALVLLFCIYPTFLLHSTEPLSHLPAACFLLLAWNAVEKARTSGKWSPLLWTGLWLGLLILVRPSALLLLLLWPMVLGGRRKDKGRFPLRYLLPWLPGLAIVVGASLAISAFAFNDGRTILLNTSNARNFYLGNNAWTPEYKTWYYGSHWAQHPDHPEAFREELQDLDSSFESEGAMAFWEASFTDILDRPGAFLRRCLSRVRTFLAYDTMAAGRLQHKGNTPLAVLALALDALCFLSLLFLAAAFLFFRSPKLHLGLAALLFLYALPYFFSFSHPTYHLPLTPMLAVMGAHAWKVRNEGMRMSVRQKRFFTGVLLLLAAVQVEWTLRMAADWI